LNPDIVCLQEVDHFEDFYKQKFEEQNYQILHLKKTKK